jgi:hypothetical protein
MCIPEFPNIVLGDVDRQPAATPFILLLMDPGITSGARQVLYKYTNIESY